MNKILITIIILYFVMVGFFGSLTLALSSPKGYCSYIWLWKYLRNNFKTIGCIIIFIVILPAIIVMITYDIFWKFIEIIFILFEKIFRKQR